MNALCQIRLTGGVAAEVSDLDARVAERSKVVAAIELEVRKMRKLSRQ